MGLYREKLEAQRRGDRRFIRKVVSWCVVGMVLIWVLAYVRAQCA